MAKKLKGEDKIINSCSECPYIDTQISAHFCFHPNIGKDKEIPYEIVWNDVKKNCPLESANKEIKIEHKYQCIYCKKENVEGYYLVRIKCLGTYYQHWDFENEKGCIENKDNTPPG